MLGNGNDNGDGEGRRPGEPTEEGHRVFIDEMRKALETEESKSASYQLSKFIGSGIGFLFATFFVPFLIVYAYNGLQPAVWADISYLPAVVGLFVFRTLVHMLRSE